MRAYPVDLPVHRDQEGGVWGLAGLQGAHWHRSQDRPEHLTHARRSRPPSARSLRDETLDLLLKPRPKDRRILVLRSPLHISGTFKDPSFRPDFKALGIRGAVALALGTIAPPAALLATIELGPGKDADCGGQYAK